MIEFLESGMRLATPLLFAAMGGILCERSGIATICLEGVLLVSAWIAAVAAYTTHSTSLAILLALIGGGLFMSIHSLFSVKLKADHIISGVAVNLLAAGITPVLTKALYGNPTNTEAIAMSERLGTWHIPFLSELPGVGPLFSQQGLVFFAFLLPFLLHLVVYYTGFGIRVAATGDAPDALRSQGVRPESVRYLSLFFGGLLTAFGGIYLSIGHSGQFTRDMTAGRGFIALAALIFGKWKPLPTLLACLFFGLADALQIRLQSTSVGGYEIPVQFIQLFPYLITLLVLVGFVGQARPPLAIGKSLS